MEKPGGLQSVGLQGVGHNWATSLLLSSHPSLALIYRLCFSIYSLRELCGSWKSFEAKTQKDNQHVFGWGNGSWVSQAPPVVAEIKMSWGKEMWGYASVFSLFPFERRIFQGQGSLRMQVGKMQGSRHHCWSLESRGSVDYCFPHVKH